MYIHCAYTRIQNISSFSFLFSGKCVQMEQNKIASYTIACCPDNITLGNGSLPFSIRCCRTTPSLSLSSQATEKMINKRKKKKYQKSITVSDEGCTRAQSLSHLSFISSYSSHFLFIPYASQSELFYFI